MTFTAYIYRITGTCGKCYYGSTKDINARKSRHMYKNGCYSKILQQPIIFEVIDTREYKLVQTLRLVEQFYLDNNECVNFQRAYVNKRKFMKQYYIENIEKLKIPYHCVCGRTIQIREKSRHLRSKFHINYLSTL